MDEQAREEFFRVKKASLPRFVAAVRCESEKFQVVEKKKQKLQREKAKSFDDEIVYRPKRIKTVEQTLFGLWVWIYERKKTC